MDTTPTSYSRRSAASGRVKGLAHLVPLEDGDGPDWRRLARTALCGFRPRRSWSATTAPVWEDGWAVQAQHETGNRTLLRAAGMETCQAVGEDYVRAHGDAHLVDPTAAWRARPPSPKQRAAAAKWRLPGAQTIATAGELSDALTAHIARRKRKAKRGA